MKILITALIFFPLFTVNTIVGQTDFFDRADVFFKTYVEDGKVKYSEIHKDGSMLQEVLYDISHNGLEGRSKEYKAAFYINAYNILVIHNIISNWPLDSPLDVPGFFNQDEFDISKEKLTLNEIENIKLREDYGNPKIHFALVCGGNGCPPLTNEAIIPGNIERRLNDLTTTALNTTLMVNVDDKTRSNQISKIFEWYESDFGNSPDAVIQYINQFRPRPLPDSYKITYLEYDWNLNGN